MTNKKRCLIIGNGASAHNFDRSKISNFEELDIIGVNTFEGHIDVVGRPNDIIIIGGGIRSGWNRKGGKNDKLSKKYWKAHGAKLIDTRYEKFLKYTIPPEKVDGVEMPSLGQNPEFKKHTGLGHSNPNAAYSMKGMVCFFFCIEAGYDEVHVTGMDFSFKVKRYDGEYMRSEYKGSKGQIIKRTREEEVVLEQTINDWFKVLNSTKFGQNIVWHQKRMGE